MKIFEIIVTSIDGSCDESKMKMSFFIVVVAPFRYYETLPCWNNKIKCRLVFESDSSDVSALIAFEQGLKQLL